MGRSGFHPEPSDLGLRCARARFLFASFCVPNPARPVVALVWLVVDGSLGSNSIEQAKAFHQSFGLTGLVVTKLDGTSRGGAIVGIWCELKLPIYFLGLGEEPEDLQPFTARNCSRAVCGLEE